ncbi:hypothetical protein ACM6Q7_06800 [Peribacillus butanolivorans]|uniref:hypothetical protein n=1 Tax=Peribacillus butanolivorans TaxID=421767 RepID=UPI0039FD82CB
MKEAVKVSETIKEIPGFSRYLADISNGLLYSKRQDKWLNPQPNDVGYVYTTLTNDYGEVKVISFYKLMQAEFDLKCWQTIQYNILGYSNKGVK